MRTFFFVLVGQVFSLLGSGMTGFALVIWAYLLTGQATTLALASLFYFAPTVLFSPLAGALQEDDGTAETFGEEGRFRLRIGEVWIRRAHDDEHGRLHASEAGFRCLVVRAGHALEGLHTAGFAELGPQGPAVAL